MALKYYYSCAVVLAAALARAEATAPPIITELKAGSPNIVIMLADDMGWGDWSRTGSPAANVTGGGTPHLEAMSRAPGTVWFQRAYSGNPICSPTRASVLTGRTPARSCIYNVDHHILCVEGHGGSTTDSAPCKRGEYSIANATRTKGYMSGFFGKWHLGSLSDRGVGSPDCYPIPTSGEHKGTCQSGYWKKNGGCCFGIDDQTSIANPLNFGFDEFVATPECAASATTNCGCFFWPSAHNNTPCELGHYNHPNLQPDSPSRDASPAPYLECMQYYAGNYSAGSAITGGKTQVEPLPFVTPVDDNDFLVDNFEGLLTRSLTAKKPFLALIFFHGVHIPYVATPAMRSLYTKAINPRTGAHFTPNEADYWGTISEIDAAVGRVRSLLTKHNVADNTWVSITADNGPEVNPAGGQSTGNYENPGRTGGLRGRKRDATEGGTREIGLVEYPPAVKANRVEERFPIITMDLMASVLDILGMKSFEGRPLDGTSLLPVLSGKQAQRPLGAGIGIHGSFPYGDTNHQCDFNLTNCKTPFRCPTNSTSVTLGDLPAGFGPNSQTGGQTSQFSWAEGNDLKLFGCKGKDPETNPGWHVFLYNLTADRAETVDLWATQRPDAKAMLGRFVKWQASVDHSKGPDEIGCHLPPKPVAYTPVKGMQSAQERCPVGDKLSSNGGGGSVQECAAHAVAMHGSAFSYSPSCNCCWVYSGCSGKLDAPKKGGSWVYKDWSSYTIDHFARPSFTTTPA